MASRCTACDAKISPATRRCRRCGAPITHTALQNREEVTLAFAPIPYPSGGKIGGRYAVVENHGAGPLGTTYRALTEDARWVAVKVLAPALVPTPFAREAFVEQLRSLVGREMPHVSLPMDVAIDPSGFVYIVSPWIHGASLRSVLRAYRAAEKLLDHDQVLALLQCTAAALRELHTTSSHGAVYPENLQLTGDSVVLTDPGVAAKLPPGVFAKYLESWPDVLPYIAPEIRSGKASSAGADLHGLGALASEMLTADPSRSRSAKFSLEALGSEVEEAMRSLVAKRPAERAGALPMLLERLARRAGAPSLPRYAPLPHPLGEERTQKAESPKPIGPRATAQGRTGNAPRRAKPGAAPVGAPAGDPSPPDPTLRPKDRTAPEPP